MTDSQIKIIEAAYPMFMEHGYKGTTTSEISKVAGINESTIFRNFKNKNTLFQVSIEYYVRMAIKIDFDILEYSGILETDLRRLIDTMFKLTLNLIPSYRLLVKRSLMDGEILRRIQEELFNQDNLFSHYLKGMMRRDMTCQMDSEIVTNLIYSQVFIAAFKLLVDRDDSSFQDELDRRAEHITNYFAGLLKKRGE